MLRDIDVAIYFLGKDRDGTVFTKNLIERNGRMFYDGNARLNKYLHIAQNLFIAKTGEPLMDAEFYAYDNGAVVPNVQENYNVLLGIKGKSVKVGDKEKTFLDKFYEAFKSAELDELIELSHEDPEWIDRNMYYSKEDQKMDLISRKKEYAEQYKDILNVFDRMQT